MDKNTKEVLQSYIEEELPLAEVPTLTEHELVPVMLMALGSKLDRLIAFLDKGKNEESGPTS
jgi:hypothetical protein